MSASTAFTIFAKRVVRDKRIPFDLTSKSEDEREFEREMHAYEHRINESIKRGYQDYLEGRYVLWDDVKDQLGANTGVEPAS